MVKIVEDTNTERAVFCLTLSMKMDDLPYCKRQKMVLKLNLQKNTSTGTGNIAALGKVSQSSDRIPGMIAQNAVDGKTYQRHTG